MRAPVEIVRRRRLRRLGTRYPAHHGLDVSEARGTIERGMGVRLAIEPTVEVEASTQDDLEAALAGLEGVLGDERAAGSSCTIGAR